MSGNERGVAATTHPLTDQQKTIREMVARLARDHFGPRAIEWDREGIALPDEERRRLAELDLLAITLPEDVGGSGAELLEALIAIEELGKTCPQAAFPVFEANVGASRVIDLFGTEEQRQRLLPPIVRGEATMAVAISEPDAGSAATDMSTRAQRIGDEIVINGMKRWCSGAGHSEQFLCYLRMGEERGANGIGAVVVDRDTPGVTYGPREKLMGMRGIHSADIFLEDVRVPVENMIIPAGGFKNLFSAFSIERLGNATMSLALAQAALDRTARYVQERRQFGRDLVEFQTVQAALADMVIQVEAARLLIYRAATTAGRGVPITLEVSIAKCFANETAKRVTDLAIQLHGGYGYSVEYEVERLHRDSHGWAIAGGTPTMQRIRIASEYLGRRFSQRV